jgi:hypothetical protein
VRFRAKREFNVCLARPSRPGLSVSAAIMKQRE